MRGFVGEFNLKWLAEKRIDQLVEEYGYDRESFGLYYEDGLRKWVVVYEP